MKPVQVTKWPIEKCTIHQDNFDAIFELNDPAEEQSFIKPFVAVKKKNRAEVLIDLARLDHYKRQKTAKIPVYFYDQDCTYMELLTAATDYFLFNNSLNNRIITKILVLLAKLPIDQNAYSNFISKKLKISTQKPVIGKYKSFNQIIKPLSDFLIIKKAPLKSWEYMAAKSGEEQQFYVRLIDELKPSLGNFLEISQQLMEYKKLDIKNHNILLSEISSILDSDVAKNKLQKIRDSIQKKRYPHLSKHRETIDSLVSELDQTKHIPLHYDQSFEKKEITGFFKLNSVEDIDGIANFFNDENRAILAKIIKKI